MTKGPRPGNVVHLSNVETSAQPKNAVRKLSWLSKRNFVPVTVAVIIGLVSPWAFAQGTAKATPKNQHHEKLVLPGVVVEKVDKGSAAEAAGIKKADVILSWSREQDREEFESPFDVELLSLHQQYFGDVSVKGMRGSTPQSWLLGTNEKTGLAVLPRLSEAMLHAYRSCEQLRKKLSPEASRCFLKAAAWAMEQREIVTFVWLAMHAADIQGQSASWQRADGIYEKLLQNRDKLSPILVNRIYWNRYLLATRHQENSKATEYLYDSVDNPALAKDNALSINALINLVRTQWLANNLVKAEECARQALNQSERIAPGSVAAAISAYSLGSVLSARGDLSSSEKYLREAGELAQKRKSIYRAYALSDLGNIEWRHGDLDTAGKNLGKAIEILIEEAPTSDRIAVAYDRLSNVARDRGNLALAEGYLLRSLTHLRKNNNREIEGATLNDLAFIALYRGESSNSEQLFLRALKLQKQYEPGSTDFGNTLMGLGMALAAQGKFAAAEHNLKENLAIQRS